MLRFAISCVVDIGAIGVVLYNVVMWSAIASGA